MNKRQKALMNTVLEVSKKHSVDISGIEILQEKEADLIGDPVNGKVWQYTNELRWVDRTIDGMLYKQVKGSGYFKSPDRQETVLQQKCISTDGEIEWIDVPTVKDTV